MSTAGSTETLTGSVTKKAFAELLRVHNSTVSKWIARKKLTPPALRPNGKIHIERARAQLAQTLGFGRMASPASAAARSTAAADATSARLNRARSAALEVAAENRAFDQRVAAGEVISVEDAGRATSRDLSDAVSAIEGWVMTVPDQILAAATDEAGLARARISFEQAWRRARGGVDDRQVLDLVEAVQIVERQIDDVVLDAAPAPNPTPPHREDEAARLARLRCEHEEAKAADALARLRQRQAEHVDADGWAAATARGFAMIRAQLEAELPALTTAIRSAGDGRRAVIAARAWLQTVRGRISGHAADTTTPTS